MGIQQRLLRGPWVLAAAAVLAVTAGMPLHLQDPRFASAPLPLAGAGVLVLIGSRAFLGLANRHAGLARLVELTDALAAAGSARQAVDAALQQSATLIRARYAELVLAGMEPGTTMRWMLRPPGNTEAGASTPTTGPHPVPDELGRRPFVLAGLLGGPGASAPERAFLAARGVRRAAVVPLRVDDAVSGHLLVADRAGDRRFTATDLRTLQAAATHAALALRTTRLIDRLHAESRHDELTGLPNRLAFRELLDDTARNAAGDGGPDGQSAQAAGHAAGGCAVMVLDFDGFKSINDTLGHPVGDELLRVLALRLQDTAGEDAVVARLGGDEFAVLSTRCAGAQAAQQLAERLLTVFDEPVELAGNRLRLGGSVGIALGPLHGATGSELLRTADIAMYAAKGSGAGSRMFSEDLVRLTARELTLAGDLEDAIRRDEIGVVAQPLVDLTTGQVHSVEVLARWRHPELGEIAPEAFFAAAERSGQVAALSARVLDRALQLCRSAQLDGRPFRVAVNLATRWLANPDLPDQVERALARHGLPADLLCLELTERGVIADQRRAEQTLERLRELGVRLALDDFGTGYSPLTFLSRLPVDQIKIDQSFVQRLGESAGERAIVQSIIDLGRNLGLEVVAEGVTDAPSLALLRQMGCRYGQGFLFSRPLPPQEFRQALAS